MSTFVGRERELGLATEALGVPGHVVLIQGPGGIGKTRLLREALNALDRGRAVVLYGRSNQLDAELAFAPLIDALTGYLDMLTPADQIEVLGGLDALGDVLDGYGLQPPTSLTVPGAERLRRTRRMDALRRLIGRIDGSPVVLVIDDAHWADDETLGAVAHLSRGLGDGSLSIAMTFRGAEASPMLRATLTTLRRAGAVVDLPLAPIDTAAVEAMLAETLGALPSRSLVDLVVRRAGGNSLFVTSLARHLRDNGLVRPTPDSSLELLPDAALGVPAEVADMMRARRDHVTRAAQLTLSALGAADAPVDILVLAAVTELSEGEVEDAVDELVLAGLAVEHAGSNQVAASHPLVGEAAYGALGERRRRRLHATFVEVIEAGDEKPNLGRLARHYRLAGSGVDRDRAIEVLRLAAERAQDRLAPREALVHLQAAVDLARRAEDPTLPALMGMQGAVWRLLDEDATAETVLHAALALVDAAADPGLAASLHAELATVHYYLGDSEASLRDLRTAMQLDPDGARQARVAWRRAHLAFTFNMPEELQAVAREVADETDRDPAATLTAAYAAQDRGDLGEAVELAERVLHLPPAPDDQLFGFQARARMVLAQAGAYLGDALPAEAHRAALLAHVERTGAPQATWRLVLSDLHLALLCGDDERVRNRREYLEMLEAGTHARPMLHWWPPLIVDAWRADLTSLRRRLADVLQVDAQHALAGSIGTDLRAISASRRGQDDQEIDLSTRPTSHSLMPPLNHAARGLIAGWRGQTADARRSAARLRGMGAADTVVGVLADLVEIHIEQDPARIVASGEDMVSRCAAGGWLRLQAWVARCSAVHAAAVDPDSGPALAAELAGIALDVADRLQDRLDADAAAAVLRAAGVPRRRLRRGAGRLTARQREIAELVAQGLTNAEIAAHLFISVRTVTTHLDNVYQRLQITSRHALAALVRDGEVT